MRPFLRRARDGGKVFLKRNGRMARSGCRNPCCGGGTTCCVCTEQAVSCDDGDRSPANVRRCACGEELLIRVQGTLTERLVGGPLGWWRLVGPGSWVWEQPVGPGSLLMEWTANVDYTVRERCRPNQSPEHTIVSASRQFHHMRLAPTEDPGPNGAPPVFTFPPDVEDISDSNAPLHGQTCGIRNASVVVLLGQNRLQAALVESWVPGATGGLCSGTYRPLPPGPNTGYNYGVAHPEGQWFVLIEDSPTVTPTVTYTGTRTCLTATVTSRLTSYFYRIFRSDPHLPPGPGNRQQIGTARASHDISMTYTVEVVRPCVRDPCGDNPGLVNELLSAWRARLAG